MTDPQKWEIWYAGFLFEDSDESKDRPVLVVEVEGVIYVSAMITSHSTRPVWGDYDLTGWHSAGLDHPSTVRLSRVVPLKRERFRKKIGDLPINDIINIQRIFY